MIWTFCSEAFAFRLFQRISNTTPICQCGRRSPGMLMGHRWNVIGTASSGILNTSSGMADLGEVKVAQGKPVAHGLVTKNVLGAHRQHLYLRMQRGDIIGEDRKSTRLN